jgi:hypothetical protein
MGVARVFNLENFKIVISSLVGAVVGVIATFTINTTLAEISLNEFFSFVNQS